MRAAQGGGDHGPGGHVAPEFVGVEGRLAPPADPLAVVVGVVVQPGVEDEEPGVASGVVDGGHQTDRAAPVLDHQMDVGQVEGGDEVLQRPAVTPDRVPPVVGRLVRAPEAEVVGGHHAVALGHERADPVAVEVGPGGLAVQEQEGAPFGAGGPRVHVVLAQAVGVHQVAGWMVPADALEAGVVGAHHARGPGGAHAQPPA